MEPNHQILAASASFRFPSDSVDHAASIWLASLYMLWVYALTR
ncbi:hypothetical protein GGD83_000068 [Rhodoblastus sphagnicola]|nr:hypothetical protein [Rhodoblastus sphagnicola]